MSIALITGASSGIGKSFARTLDTYNLTELWLVARKRSQLRTVADSLVTPCKVVCCDLSTKEGLAYLATELARENPTISYTVNNAGFGLNGDFSELSRTEQMAMVDLNCRAIVALAHLSIPYMHSKSHLLTTSSIAGFGPLGSFALYAASKAFATSFSVALAIELKEKGIIVTTIAPGSVATNFQAKSRSGSTREKKFFSKRSNPDSVVRQALHDSKKGKIFSVYGFSSKLISVIAPLLPQYFAARLAYTTIYPKPSPPLTTRDQ